MKEAAALNPLSVTFVDPALEREFVASHMVDHNGAARLARFMTILAALFAFLAVFLGDLAVDITPLQVWFAWVRAAAFVLLAAFARLAPAWWKRLLCTRYVLMRRLFLGVFVVAMAAEIVFYEQEFGVIGREYATQPRVLECETALTSTLLVLLLFVHYWLFSQLSYVTSADVAIAAALLVVATPATGASSNTLDWTITFGVGAAFVMVASVSHHRSSSRFRRFHFLLVRRLRRENIKITTFFGTQRVEDGDAGADGADVKPAYVVDPSEVEVGDVIGAGGFGTVYAGTWRGTKVAVKQLHNGSEGTQLELIEEAGKINAARHPHVVMFLCLAVSDHLTWMVTELCQLGALSDLIYAATMNETVLPMRRRLSILAQAASGMDFLHQTTPPILHRDLKPANILVDERWTAKIADFGTARSRRGGDDHAAGTLLYAAPETLRGDPHLPASDVYSFSLCVYETLSGKLPYAQAIQDGAGVHQVAQLIINGVRPDLDADAFQNDAQLRKLVIAAWSDTPSERPSFSTLHQFFAGAEAALSVHLSSAGSSMGSEATAVLHRPRVTASCPALVRLVDGRSGANQMDSVVAFGREVAAVRERHRGMCSIHDADFAQFTFLAHDSVAAIRLAADFLVECASMVVAIAGAVEADSVRAALLAEDTDGVLIVGAGMADELAGLLDDYVELEAGPHVRRFEPASGRPMTVHATSGGDAIGIAGAELAIGAPRGVSPLGPWFDATRNGEPVTAKLVDGVGRSLAATTALLENLHVGLRHKHLVGVFGVARLDARLFVVSEFVDKTFKEVLDAEPRADRRVDLVGQAALGLAFLHHALPGQAHGALSPTAIAVDTAHTVARVMDWGTLGPRRDARVCTRTLTASPRYMAPELLQQDGRPTPASDVWALGMLVIDAEVGLDGRGARQTWAEIVDERLRGLRPVMAGLRTHIRAAADAVLANDPQSRLAAADLAGMLLEP